MKSKLLIPLLVFSVLLNSFYSTAQISKNYTGSVDFVTINNISLPVNSLSIMDSLDAGNQKVHTASFEIKVTNNEQVKKLLTDLQSSFQNQVSFSLVFSKANSQYQVMEQRNYSRTMVKEILLSGLAGAAKEPVSVNISIQAEQVAIINGRGEKMNIAIGGKNMAAMASNYKFELDGQVMSKVIQISSLRIGTSSDGTQRFFIELPLADAASWYDWFNNAKGGDTKKSVRIALLSADLRTEIFSLELSNTEIISLAVQSSSGQETIPG